MNMMYVDAKELMEAIKILKEHCVDTHYCTECMFYGRECYINYPRKWETDSLTKEINITVTAPYYEIQHFLKTKRTNRDLQKAVKTGLVVYEQVTKEEEENKK